jgi:hypothetical protein
VDIKSRKTGIVVLVVLALTITFFVVFSHFREATGTGNGEGLSAFKIESFSENGAWAYRIYENDTPVIEQRSVPGVGGNPGFKTKDDALKIANLVKRKLDRGIFPPTITKHELDSLRVGY